MIQIEGVSKAFRLYRKPSDRLRELVLRRPYHQVHQALEGISFTLEQGSTLGVIGRNGAGKSTLLKLLTGVLLPDTGTVQVKGLVTGLLELGTGFNMEMTGLQNIRANAALLGMDRAEIEERMPDIVAFAELGEFINETVQTYSSGMLMRLGFAVAIHARPTCFVVDEALAVGDAYFQQKCMRAIHAFREQGGSVLFVSHDMGAVRALCDQAILLEGGRIIDHGSPKAVVDHYHAMILRKTHEGPLPLAIQRPMEENPAAPLADTGQATLLGVRMLDPNGEPLHEVVSEHRVGIEVRVRIGQDLAEPYYGIGLRDRLGQSAFETNTFFVNRTSDPVKAGDEVCIYWELECNLRAGDYGVTVGIANHAESDGSFRETVFFAHEVAILKVATHPEAVRYDGWCNLRPRVVVTGTPIDTL